VTRLAAILVLIAVLASAGSAALYAAEEPAAEEPAASTFVSLKLDGACDDVNNRLWLTNSHTYKTIVTKVRWRAAGGKDLSEDFYPGPNTVREIGCAAEGEILEAQFAAF